MARGAALHEQPMGISQIALESGFVPALPRELSAGGKHHGLPDS